MLLLLLCVAVLCHSFFSFGFSLCVTHTECDSILGLFAFCIICILLVGGGFGGFGHHFLLLLFCGWLVL
jgi:hypothetical protein